MQEERRSFAPGTFTNVLLAELAQAEDTGHLSQRLRSRLENSGAEVQFIEPLGGPIPLFTHSRSEGRPGAATRPIPPNERVRTFDDNAATIDLLGRDAFAEVIAARIDDAFRQITDTEKDNAFMVHLHGPWGSGKSSLLNFLKDKLSSETRPMDDRWLVVEFNAWRHQRLRTPWWPLIKSIYEAASEHRGKAMPMITRTRWTWLLWHFRARWARPTGVFLLVVTAALLLTKFYAKDLSEGAETVIKTFVAVFGALGTLITLVKNPALAPNKAAQDAEELRVDTLDLIRRFFKRMVKTVRRPIIVFIDDLDRCDSAYVVQLLEGIQTLFKDAKVAYVVAADRNWIRHSFEQNYNTFKDVIGGPGRPLGHLFLEKMFQISAAVPRLGSARQANYWSELIKLNDVLPAPAVHRAAQRRQAALLLRRINATTMEAVQSEVDRAILAQDPGLAQAISEAGAIHLTSVQVQETAEHRLKDFAELLEQNPRAMKRLVNAFGINQAALLLERKRVDPGALVRWTILEMRWPLFAEAIAREPERLSDILAGEDLNVDGLAPATRALAKSAEVRRLVGVLPSLKAPGQLTEQDIRDIVGEEVATERLTVKDAAEPEPKSSNTGVPPSPL